MSPDPTPYPIDHVAERGAAEDPALVLRGETLSFDALRSRVGLLAGWLAMQGFAPGDRVATWAAKGLLTSLMPLAAARAGLVHVPINPLLKHSQVAHILADSGAMLLIANSGRIASLDVGDVPSACRTMADEAALEAATDSGDVLSASKANPDDLAAILYTSGSTGLPKGVMLSHANLWMGAVSVADYTNLAADDVTLAVLPFSFDYGQNQLFATWYAGGSVVPLDYLTARDVVRAVERHGVTTLAAVPPLWIQLLEQDWPADVAASLRRLTNSGGALTEGMVRGLRATFPEADLYPMYGLTEAFRSTYLDPGLVDSHPSSMGKAIPFAEILVISDDGTVARPDEEGELVHCGLLVAQGYWQDAKRTAERFRPAPAASLYGGTAVWSGDRVMRDAEGLLYFVGRRDAMIKSSGNRISPQEIESVALASGLVAEAVALGVPDDRLGQAIHLVVRGTESDNSALEKALKRELPNFMQPHAIHWREAMPLNANGKIDRNALATELSA